MQPSDNIEQIWELVFQSLSESKECSGSVMDVFISKLTLVDLDDKTATFSTPLFYVEIIKNRFSEVLIKHFEKIIGYKVEINIKAQFADEPDYYAHAGDPIASVTAGIHADNIDSYEPPKQTKNSGSEGKNNDIGTEYTFDNFIVGSSNRFAHAACVAVADDLQGQYNPLFIYGQSGLGKTHLMYAITNQVRANHPDAKIIYIKGEEFTNELIDALSNKTTAAFKEKYRKIDVLLIDDIQFIAGKESTQEEFFHTFNTLYEDHKQIILTSDRPPKEIKTLEDRIRSRFEWGVIADIQPPDFELRLAILKNKARSMNLMVPDDVLEFLAEKLHSNIRQIEGVIKKLGAKSLLTGEPINLDLVKRSIPEFIKENEPVETTVARITAIVAKKYGVTSNDIMSSKRSQDIAFARHVSIYVTRAVTELSLPSLGKMFNRDHSTILSSCTVIENKMNSDMKIKNDISDIIREIKD